MTQSHISNASPAVIVDIPFLQTSRELAEENLQHLASSFSVLADVEQTGVLRWADIHAHEEHLMDAIHRLRTYILSLKLADKIDGLEGEQRSGAETGTGLGWESQLERDDRNAVYF